MTSGHSSGARPRARTRTQAPRAAPKTGPRQVVVFTLGDEDYAFPIEQVREIIRYTRPRSVASTLPWVLGVINLRGRIVTIYDLASRLGAKSAAGEAAKIVIVEASGHGGGVIVDDVKAVQTLPEQQLEPVPTPTAPIVDAIATVGERLVILLKPEALFEEGG